MTHKTYTLKHHTSARSFEGKSFEHLPKNIFRTAKSYVVDSSLYEIHQTWINLNPEWDCYFFNDNDQRSFIEKYFDSEVLWAYDQIIPGAFKADLWRYCVLYIKGGVYVDHKFALLKPLNDILPDDIQFCTIKDFGKSKERRREHNAYLWQGFLVATPGTLCLNIAINQIVYHVKNGFYGNDPLSITGPGLIGQALNFSIDKYGKKAITVGRHHCKSFVYDIQNPATFKPFIEVSLFDHGVCLSSKIFTEAHKPYLNKLRDTYANHWFLGTVYAHAKCEREYSAFYWNKAPKIIRRHIQKLRNLDQIDEAHQLTQKSVVILSFWLRLRLRLRQWLHTLKHT